MLHTLASGAAPLAVQLLALLATAAAVAALLRPFKLQVIPGYLIAGMIVGPHALGLVSDADGVESISSLAIILLMFTIGLDLDTTSERSGLLPILAVGVGSTIAVSACLFLVFLTLGLSPPVATLLGLAGGMSSTAVLVRTLVSRRETKTVHGRITLGVSIVQDIAAVVVMALVPVLARWAGAHADLEPTNPSTLPRGLELFTAALKALGGVTVMLALGKYLLPRMLEYISRVGGHELVLVVSTAVALGAAIATSYIGFSPEMGAFLAGLLLGSTPYRYQLGGQFAPMRDLLMAIFFTAVGMNVAPSLLVSNWFTILALAAIVVIVKTLLIAGMTWSAGATGSTSLISGIYLGNAGEFSLVVISAGVSGSLLTRDESGVGIAVIVVTLAVSPMLFDGAHMLADRMRRVRVAPWGHRSLREVEHAPTSAAEAPASSDGLLRHVIIAGFGIVGRTLADRFAVMGVPLTIIELNPRTVSRQASVGRRVIYGDVTNPEVLESAGVREADAVLITIPDDEATMRACRMIREIAPRAYVAARTGFLSGKFIAHQLGADLVTVEEIATAQAMEKEVMLHLHEILRRRLEREHPPSTTQ